MKKASFAACAMALALSAGSALAADLPSIKGPPVYVPPPPLWTGFYVGVNAGGTWSGSNSINVATSPFLTDPISLSTAAIANGVLSANSGGFIGGGQVGYNYQFSNTFVAGLEADIQGLTGGGSGSAASASRVSFPAFNGGAPSLQLTLQLPLYLPRRGLIISAHCADVSVISLRRPCSLMRPAAWPMARRNSQPTSSNPV